MSYQAVVRTGKNTLVAKQPIGLRISIIQGKFKSSELNKGVYNPTYKSGFTALPNGNLGFSNQVALWWVDYKQLNI